MRVREKETEKENTKEDVLVHVCRRFCVFVFENVSCVCVLVRGYVSKSVC